MKNRFLVTLILCMSLCNTSLAQLMGGCYNEIKASKVSVKCSDLNLKGKVKTIKATSAGNKNYSLSSFNESGFLVSLSDSNTSVIATYQNEQLVHIQYDSYNRSRELFFNASGFLEKEIVENNGDKKEITESYYKYNSAFDTVVVSYKHTPDRNMWHIVLVDSFYFSFDSKNRIIEERNVSVHSDDRSYGSTKTYSYDSLTGKPIYVTFMSDCAREGRNSCANYMLTMKYDERNNLVYEQLYDATVRNSLWSYGYTYHATYNENNELIDERFEQQNEKGNGIVGINKTGKTENNRKIIYKYDSNGNWIKTFEVDAEGHKTLIRKRVIKYYH